MVRRPLLRLRSGLSALLACGCLLTAAGCSEGLPAVESIGKNQTFGETFFNLICGRLAYTEALARGKSKPPPALGSETSYVDVAGDSTRLACRLGAAHLPADAGSTIPRTAALVGRRTTFVKAMDAVLPAAQLDDVQQYLLDVLPLTDNGQMPGLVEQLAATVQKQLETDSKSQEALARLDGRPGYLPAAAARGMLGAIGDYPDLFGLLDTVTAFADTKAAGRKPLLDLLDALAYELRAARAVDDPTRTDRSTVSAADRPLRLALDFVLKDKLVKGSGTPVPLVRRDPRGVAQVMTDDSTGAPLAPFVDKDGDKLADLDADGRFVTADGSTAAPLPFAVDTTIRDTAPSRSSDGRALDASGKPLFAYVDLDTTLLPPLAGDLLQLLETRRNIGVRLLRGATIFLGDRIALTKKKGTESLSYSGFDSKNSVLLDLAHGAFQTLRDPNVDVLLEVADLFLATYEAQLSRILVALLDVIDLVDDYPKAELADKNTLFDDLVPLVQKIVTTHKSGRKTGLLEDLIAAMADPKTRHLGKMMVPFVTYRDIHVLDAKTQKVTDADGTPASFVTQVDRTKSDSDFNRSIFQRVLHLLNNVKGVSLGNKANAQIYYKNVKMGEPVKKAGDLFYIKNAAVLFLQTIACEKDPKTDACVWQNSTTCKAKNTCRIVPKAELKVNQGIVLGTSPSGKQTTLKELLDDFNTDVDDLFEKATTITGFSTRPTPESMLKLMSLPLSSDMAALLNTVKDTQGNHSIADKEGNSVYAFHKGSATSWLVAYPKLTCAKAKGYDAGAPCTIFDALRPLVQAFADHDAEEIFIDLLTVAHKHWPSKNSSNHQFTQTTVKGYAAGTAAQSYEPFLAAALDKTDLMDALAARAPALDSMRLSDGRLAKSALVKSISFVVDPTASPALAYRDGTTYSLRGDGTKVSCSSSSCVTPLYLLVDALSDLLDVKDAAEKGSQKALVEAFEDALSDAVDLFLATEGSGANMMLAKRHLVPLARQAVAFLRKRLAAHKTAGDSAAWLGKELPGHLDDIMSSPLLPTAVDLLAVVEADKAMLHTVYNLMEHFLANGVKNLAFRRAAVAVLDLAQLLLDDPTLLPLMHAVGRVAPRSEGLVTAALDFVRPSFLRDRTRIFPRLIKNALGSFAAGRSPAGELVDIALSVHRTTPGSTTPLQGKDVGRVLTETRDFLAHKDAGLARFFKLIKDRCGGTPCKTAGK